jgi:hypothetical protein
MLAVVCDELPVSLLRRMIEPSGLFNLQILVQDLCDRAWELGGSAWCR